MTLGYFGVWSISGEIELHRPGRDFGQIVVIGRASRAFKNALVKFSKIRNFVRGRRP